MDFNTMVIGYKKQELLDPPPLPPPRAHGFTTVFGGPVLLIFLSILCCVYCFICLHPVSCVLNVADVSGLSILDCPFVFL